MTVVNNPGSWSTIYAPLRHAEWHGCTPTDLVFPFFVFIMGTAIAFAMPTKTYDSSTFNKIFVRSLRMINLGLFFNFFGKIQFLDLEGIPLMIIRLLITAIVGYALMGNFNQKTKTYLAIGCFIVFMFLAYSGIPAYENVRLPGVLQRIGIIYFIASLLYLKTTPKIQLIVSSILLLGYWALMTLVPAPGFCNYQSRKRNQFSYLGGPNDVIRTCLGSYQNLGPRRYSKYNSCYSNGFIRPSNWAITQYEYIQKIKSTKNA